MNLAKVIFADVTKVTDCKTGRFIWVYRSVTRLILRALKEQRISLAGGSEPEQIEKSEIPRRGGVMVPSPPLKYRPHKQGLEGQE